MNYRGNEKYVLVLVQCHDGIITNSINLLRLTLVFNLCNTKQIYLVRDNRHWTRTRIKKSYYAAVAKDDKFIIMFFLFF